MSAEHITWGELGCPKAVGFYRCRGESVRVRTIHIAVAEGDPAAQFTLVVLRPPMGPAEYSLGHRVA